MIQPPLNNVAQQQRQPAPGRLSSSLSEPAHLVGQLNADGTASLQAGNAASLRLPRPGSPNAAINAVASESTSESGSEEDYDAIQHDPATIIEGSEGGGFEEKHQGVSLATPRPVATRLQSIPITLNRSGEKGKYVLTAEEEALKEVLRMSIERVGRAPELVLDRP